MFHTIDEFLHSWKYEADSTQKYLDALTDESLKQESMPGSRTLGFLGWHITITIGEMMHRAGLKFDKPDDDAQMPNEAREIAATYKITSSLFVEALKSQWKNEELNDEVDMYGFKWKKSYVLEVLIVHQVHHRGQMSVLMRQAGLPVPSVYGPVYEDWEKMGMKPMP